MKYRNWVGSFTTFPYFEKKFRSRVSLTSDGSPPRNTFGYFIILASRFPFCAPFALQDFGSIFIERETIKCRNKYRSAYCATVETMWPTGQSELNAAAIPERDETKATRPSGFRILHDCALNNFTVSTEMLFQFLCRQWISYRTSWERTCSITYRLSCPRTVLRQTASVSQGWCMHEIRGQLHCKSIDQWRILKLPTKKTAALIACTELWKI